MKYKPLISPSSPSALCTYRSALKFSLIVATLLPVAAYADPIDIDEMLTNLQNQLPQLTKFVTACAYLGGFFMMIKALYSLKAYGEMRTMMAVSTDLRGPMTTLLIGACLLFTPTIIDSGLITVYGSKNILSYDDTGSQWDHLSETIIAIVQFVGGVAFIRGLFIFHKLGSGQAQQGTFAKAIIHLIGGVIALNIVQATHILFTTLGVDWGST